MWAVHLINPVAIIDIGHTALLAAGMAAAASIYSKYILHLHMQGWPG